MRHSVISKLRYFNSVVETGSISQASQHFDVQPSSVSRQLAALEKELGVRLLNRTTRNLGLTEAGSRFYQYSQRIVAELDEAQRAVNDLQQAPRGCLRLSMTVGFGEAVVLPLLPSFGCRYPEIELQLELTERVVDLVEENIDIAIRSGQLPDSSLVAKRLQYNNFILCASPQYLQRRGHPTTLSDLSDHLCIRYGYSGWRDWYCLDERPQRMQLNSELTVDTVNGQRQLLLSHGGVALIPYWAVSDDLRQGRLVEVLPNHRISPTEVPSSTYALYLKREFVAPKIRVFLDYLSEQLGTPLAR
ncbi:LysR family transcriptional regulator [Ferrimonas kyonanensis]|uniref:LysR family transcriptional regulator n=1 Tax=Ferrimonas kyonanensis TaxID=364763 RepID=UPI0004848DD6|nr:LysR family transcriptional regulator [Ferrimonas kyonanensis]